MNKPASLLLCCLVAASAFASAQEPSARARAYENYRRPITEPTYGRAKVKALIKSIKKKDNEDGDFTSVLPTSKFNSLTLEEQFTYTMIHGERGLQNCDAMMPIEGADKMIFAHIPDPFRDDTVWSESQLAFMNAHRPQFINMLRDTMKLRHRAGANIKQAIFELKAYELIPDLTSLYIEQRKDHDILTLLNLLMKEGNYLPFINSSSYAKLFGDDASWSTALVANRENQDLVISRATDFYKSKT
ncbi:MAG: hypothetical protein ABUL49_01040 [bacterium]